MSGLIGWLDPLGNFIECSYGEHAKVANELLDSQQIEDNLDWNNQYVHFGFIRSLGEYTISVSNDSNTITSEQQEWISANFDKLSENQQMYAEFLTTI